MKEKAEEIFRAQSRLTPEEFAYYHVRIDSKTKEVQCERAEMSSQVR
jgi:hypothetical protein